jgi:glutathione S-transferase
MITLHYYPGNASFTPHVLLHELGVPFERALVDRTQAAHKAPAYLKLNPNGQIPVLVDGDLVLYETAAICLHLADRHPQAGLAPAVGTAERAQLYKWLIWMTNTLQPRLMHFFYPERVVDPTDIAAAAQVKARAEADVVALLGQLDAQLGSHGGPWLLGERFGIADPFAFMLCRWTRGFKSKPARNFVHLAPYLARVLARPAVARTVSVEQLAAPVY